MKWAKAGKLQREASIQVDDIETLRRQSDKGRLRERRSKCSMVRQEHPNVAGILVVIWDHLMNEPIAALLNPASGLFTANTFDREREHSQKWMRS